MNNSVTVRPVTAQDLPRVRHLHDRVFGPGALTRTAYRLREGTPAISPFCRLAMIGDDLVASVRFTEIEIGGTPEALLLGPLAVAPEYANQGYGRQLVSAGLEAAKSADRRLVILVGDLPYYGRLGFVRVPPGQIQFPGPVDRARILAAELHPGALANYTGLVSGKPA